MPLKVIDNMFFSSEKSFEIDASLFVQKPYLRTSYIESNIEEGIDLKSQF